MPRNTIRILGENIAKGDNVVVSFATERTVALVGVVGTVTRIRAFDEETGEPVCKIDSGKHNPELWFSDLRTGIEIGPIERDEIHSIGPVDGPWTSPAEMRAMGHDPGIQDCDDDEPRPIGIDKDEALAIESALEVAAQAVSEGRVPDIQRQYERADNLRSISARICRQRNRIAE